MFILTAYLNPSALKEATFAGKKTVGCLPGSFHALPYSFNSHYSFQKDDVKEHITRMLLESGVRLNAIPFQAPELQFLYLPSKFSSSLSSPGDIFLDMASYFPRKSGILERLHITIQCLKDKRMFCKWSAPH
ncbi:hypothetical protein CDAR_178291 [Caerostris darwini]|uniref:Uncharacterized protein n=1 Tax=Caerostris darwini TaxID=1538125 RepID=A0AAV4VY80_9ARAC|nr:hypothetical protein CDAR_178291 [Caerostris darwini]